MTIVDVGLDRGRPGGGPEWICFSRGPIGRHSIALVERGLIAKFFRSSLLLVFSLLSQRCLPPGLYLAPEPLGRETASDSGMIEGLRYLR